MSGWVAGGCLFSALPLLAALLLADVSLNKLSRQAEALADNSLRIAQLGTGLRDTLGNLERNTWQYLALQNPTLGEIVGRRLIETDNILKQLLSQEPAEPLRTKVLQVQAGMRDVERAWSAHDLTGIGDHVHELLKQSDPIIDLARATVDDRVAKFRSETAATHRLMGVSVLALIPLAGLLALGFSHAVTRPLRDMG
ncbi:MAG: hypothetical protein ACRETM_09860, partial [Stenotrophobium sp.]